MHGAIMKGPGEGRMREVSNACRECLLAAAIPFVEATSRLEGVRRIALINALTTSTPHPEGIELLVTVEDEADLVPLAAQGRKLLGRTLHCGNYGANVFIASPRSHYLGRLCQWRVCQPGERMICDALHCGRRPYLHDDLRTITLERSLIIAPPLELWPHIVTRVAVPADVEQSLLTPLMQRLDVQRSEQIIPRAVRERIVKTKRGAIDTIAREVLSHAAAWFHLPLTEELLCDLIEIVPLERYRTMLQLPEIDQIRRLWVVEVADQTCFVAQRMQEGNAIYRVW